MMTFKPMWYATDSTGAIMQRQADGRWLTLRFMYPGAAEREVERMNEHLTEVYRDNGYIVKGGVK